MIFVDSNVFICFLTDADPAQQKQASRLFERARRGQVRLATGPPVLFELAWTLRRVFRFPRERVFEALVALPSIPGLHLTDRPLVERALELAASTKSEFADAYLAASAEAAGAKSIATFDGDDFKRFAIPLYEFPHTA